MTLTPVTVADVRLHPVSLPLKTPFGTSYGQQTHRTGLLIELHTTDGAVGWGESPLDTYPGYVYETTVTGEHALRDFLLPLVIGQRLSEPVDLPLLLAPVRGHQSARSGLEAALWDAFAHTNRLRLADLLARYTPGHVPLDRVRPGTAVGLAGDVEATLDRIADRIAQGYGRVKLKIKPGQDLDLLQAVRQRFPALPLMADANSAYRPQDADHLARLDALNLLMIEQPLAHDDLLEHARLARRLETPICLDESVRSLHDWRLATEIGAGRVLNLKPSRVGGFTEALHIYNFSVEHGLDLWVGGMLETGIGRAGALALASLPGFTLPGDVGASDRYFAQDLITPPFRLGPDGTIALPTGPGIGVALRLP